MIIEVLELVSSIAVEIVEVSGKMLVETFWCKHAF